MNKTEVKTRIVDHLRTGGNVYKPNGFMHAIMHQVGLADRGASRSPNRQLVMQAMTELEAERRVTITRRNKQVVGICLDSDDSERFVPATAEGRRQSRWATDASGRHLPGTLPDHLVGPLRVRMLDPQILHKSKQNGTKPMTESSTIEYHYGDQFLDTLNAALAELRRHVDATGLGDGLSIKKVLEATGLTSSQVARVLDFLRALDLYSTFKSGWARSSYQVKLEPIELTPDMMERARKVVDSIKSGTTSKHSPAVAGQDPLDQLAQIVESLESRLAAATANEKDLRKALRNANDKVATRDKRIAKLQEQLREAKAAQPAPLEQVSDRVAAVLGRYS